MGTDNLPPADTRLNTAMALPVEVTGPLDKRFGVGTRDLDARDLARLEAERARVQGIYRRREWFGGTQYDRLDAATGEVSGITDLDCLPEHQRRLAYSTQIEESVRFVASQLMEGFLIEAEADTVQAVIDDTLTASPQLTAGGDLDDVTLLSVLTDALVAGDTPVHVRWDPARQCPWLEFWDSEQVEFETDPEAWSVITAVTVTEPTWRTIGAETRLAVRATRWEMRDGQCWRTVAWDGADPETEQPLGLPFVPWVPVRGREGALRTIRGASIITDRAIRLASRYDATEQLSYVIARYNSHGNLAVVGDLAMLQAEQDGQQRKDVADVLTFPGGTNLTAISLPTNPEMIQHQRGVLLDALYAVFGVARMDTETLDGMGNLSGFALAILNRKTDSTFGQIGKTYARDLKRVLSMALDLYAYRVGAGDTDGDPDTIDRATGIDPTSVFPDRAIRVTMGSGYVVDQDATRADFTAKLLSRRTALRERGMSDDQIDEIEQEMADEAEAEGRQTTEATGATPEAQAAIRDRLALESEIAAIGDPATV